jgi:hypothetical protein
MFWHRDPRAEASDRVRSSKSRCIHERPLPTANAVRLELTSRLLRQTKRAGGTLRARCARRSLLSSTGGFHATSGVVRSCGDDPRRCPCGNVCSLQLAGSLLWSHPETPTPRRQSQRQHRSPPPLQARTTRPTSPASTLWPAAESVGPLAEGRQPGELLARVGVTAPRSANATAKTADGNRRSSERNGRKRISSTTPVPCRPQHFGC